MNIVKSMKHVGIQLLVLTALLSSGLAFVAPRIAQASPLALFADAAIRCILPDGGGGILTKYPNTNNTTCCPEVAQDSLSCLYEKYLNPTIKLLAALVGVVVVIGIVFGAIEYTTSNGDPQRASSGKKHITNALLSMVVFLLLYAFLQFIVPGGL